MGGELGGLAPSPKPAAQGGPRSLDEVSPAAVGRWDAVHPLTLTLVLTTHPPHTLTSHPHTLTTRPHRSLDHPRWDPDRKAWAALGALGGRVQHLHVSGACVFASGSLRVDGRVPAGVHAVAHQVAP